jgi:hypothetical protein
MTDPEKGNPSPQRTQRNTEKQESKDRKGKNLPLINTDDADQKSQEPKANG